MADEGKNFAALLNGLARRIYYGESEISQEFLKNELYQNISIEAFDQLTRQAMNLMKSMVSADMDFKQLDAFLLSHIKKREGGITEMKAKIFTKFWRNHKSKIHDAIVDSSTWNNKLKNMAWRVDIQSQTRHQSHVNTPIAIVELELAALNNDKDNKIQFELDEAKLTNVLKDLREIDDEVKRLVQP